MPVILLHDHVIGVKMEDVCVTDAMTLVIMYLPRAYDDTKKLVF
jgi:hypothetical protein